ncbi:alpha/beta hydrolase [Streptomonospora salina]|uniref:Phospholipase/carboxylesterase n=1 Tax=Streptomonospora salina TaxID=104205 RepID=A0A841E559_9ACTN|nr:alpha/beta hydrolase [Streptomonospora salina]MBB5998275.1 phospholipase/carboxylesterase [Streptomonospora salina]
MTTTEDFHHVYVPAEEPGHPTLLLLHGTGADEHDLLALGRALAPGAGLLSPRGNVDEQGANRWFRRLREGVFDVDDVVARAGELAGFVSAAVDRYGFDPRSLIAVGFSNGANIGAATLLLHPGTLAGAALFAAAAPLQDREPADVDLSGTPVFLGAGQADPITTIDDARLLDRQLRARGADATLHEHRGGHELPPAVLAAAQSWLVGSGPTVSPDPRNRAEPPSAAADGTG